MGKGNWAHANRIMREWNWLHYQPIVVAPAAGGEGFTVIDGQHRLEAARKHPKIARLPCYIVDAADLGAQARAFVALNARRIGVKMTLTGEYSIGDGPTRKLSKDTFVLTHKDQSAAYAFLPWVGAGPKGPVKAEKPSGDDF